MCVLVADSLVDRLVDRQGAPPLKISISDNVASLVHSLRGECVYLEAVRSSMCGKRVFAPL